MLLLVVMTGLGAVVVVVVVGCDDRGLGAVIVVTVAIGCEDGTSGCWL